MHKATFNPHSLLSHRKGQTVEILGTAYDPEGTGDLWVVRFEDGFQPTAWGEELTPLDGSSKDEWPAQPIKCN